jgi:hypothetical protein
VCCGKRLVIFALKLAEKKSFSVCLIGGTSYWLVICLSNKHNGCHLCCGMDCLLFYYQSAHHTNRILDFVDVVCEKCHTTIVSQKLPLLLPFFCLSH